MSLTFVRVLGLLWLAVAANGYLIAPIRRVTTIYLTPALSPFHSFLTERTSRIALSVPNLSLITSLGSGLVGVVQGVVRYYSRLWKGYLNCLENEKRRQKSRSLFAASVLPPVREVDDDSRETVESDVEHDTSVSISQVLPSSSSQALHSDTLKTRSSLAPVGKAQSSIDQDRISTVKILHKLGKHLAPPRAFASPEGLPPPAAQYKSAIPVYNSILQEYAATAQGNQTSSTVPASSTSKASAQNPPELMEMSSELIQSPRESMQVLPAPPKRSYWPPSRAAASRQASVPPIVPPSEPSAAPVTRSYAASAAVIYKSFPLAEKPAILDESPAIEAMVAQETEREPSGSRKNYWPGRRTW